MLHGFNYDYFTANCTESWQQQTLITKKKQRVIFTFRVMSSEQEASS